MRVGVFLVAVLTLALATAAGAQGVPDVELPTSPRGLAAIQVAGEWVEAGNGQQYRNGRWITVDYGRPILRGRQNIFGSGASYGEAVGDGSAVWRAGANATTRLTTQVPLEIGGTTIQPGIYNVLVDLTGGAWTLVLSTQPVQESFDPSDTTNLFGSINYDPQFDVLRAPMTVDTAPVSGEQVLIDFVDVTTAGGTLLIAWERTAAMVGFRIVP